MELLAHRTVAHLKSSSRIVESAFGHIGVDQALRESVASAGRELDAHAPCLHQHTRFPFLTNYILKIHNHKHFLHGRVLATPAWFGAFVRRKDRSRYTEIVKKGFYRET